MKYEKIAAEMNFLPFVFYEVDKRAKEMYVYCPNCDQVHTIELTKSHNVNWVKENIAPCCFEYYCRIPKYLNDVYRHKRAEQGIYVSEWEQVGEDVKLNVYLHKLSCDALNYNLDDGYCNDMGHNARAFRRVPYSSYEKVVEFCFRNNGTVTMKSRLYVPMCTSRVSVGDWREKKKWSSTCYWFEVIDDSWEELKGTFLEQYIADAAGYSKIRDEINNINGPTADQYTIAFMILMHTKPAVKRLWKAGYRELVFNKVYEYVYQGLSTEARYYAGIPSYEVSGKILNWNGKSVEKILRVKPQIADKLKPRHEIVPEEVLGIQRLLKLNGGNIAVDEDNIGIVVHGRFSSLKKIVDENGLPIGRVFKYLRNQKRKSNNSISHVVSDYCDYIEAKVALGAKLTSDVVYPSRLSTAHDRAIAERKKLAVECRDRSFERVIQNYLSLKFESEKYVIEPVKRATQLVKEAERMHNCAGGYIDRVISGQCLIFVIRQKDKPRTPFYMLELNCADWKILQNRGCGNRAAPKEIDNEVKQFASVWLNSVVKPFVAVMKSKKVA